MKPQYTVRQLKVNKLVVGAGTVGILYFVDKRGRSCLIQIAWNPDWVDVKEGNNLLKEE